ncbi:MAG: serine protease [Lachnospiraceae bacterium]|nr:serine protease [Lachnospiraceae bacterium]
MIDNKENNIENNNEEMGEDTENTSIEEDRAMTEENRIEEKEEERVEEMFESPKYYTYENTENNKIVSDERKDNMEPAKKKKGRFLGKVVAVVLSAVLFGVSAGAGFYFVDKHFNDNNDKEQTKVEQGDKTGANTTIATTVVSNNTVETKSDIADIVEEAMPSVVSITCTSTHNITIWPGYYDQREYDSSGSGIIIGENDDELLIVTNNHVVEDTDKVQITFADGESYEATVKGTDASVDLAVCSVSKKDLKDETVKAIKIAVIGDSSKLRTGELAIAIGNALGYGQSVTKGCISALSREVKIDQTTYTAIQTDAAINPGNSGGALLNGKGEVIGINSAKLASEDVEGMGYAIPVSKVLPIIQELMNKEHIPDEEKGYLGVVCSTVSKEISQLYNCPAGVMFTEIVEDGPAAEQGMLKGDIITKINDIEVTSNEQLIDKVGDYRAGEKITLTFERFEDGKYNEMKKELTLGKRPEGFSNQVTDDENNK